MLRFLSDEKYIKIYWSVKVTKKFKLTLKDGSVVSYTKDENGEIQYFPEKDLDPKTAKPGGMNYTTRYIKERGNTRCSIIYVKNMGEI